MSAKFILFSQHFFFLGVRHELRFLVDPSREIEEVGRVKKAAILSQQIMISTSASSYKSAKKGKFFYLFYPLVFRFRRWVQMMFGIVSSLYILTQFHNMLSKKPNLMPPESKKVKNWIKFLKCDPKRKLLIWNQKKTFFVCRQIEIDVFILHQIMTQRCFISSYPSLINRWKFFIVPQHKCFSVH